MREGWEVKALKDLCTDYKSAIVDGPFGSNLKREHFTTEGIPVLKIQNIKIHKINNKKIDYVTPEKARELKRHSFTVGDIIMTKLGDPLGVSAIVEGIKEGIIVADLVRVRADKIDTKFLCYQLNSPFVQDAINKQQKGATRPRVKISMVRDLQINTPPLAEQKRIVAVLDQAFAGIEQALAAARKNLANARELFETTLNATFTQKGEGWVASTIEKLCVIGDGNHSSKYPKKSEMVTYGVPFIRGTNLVDGQISSNNILYISESKHQEIKKGHLKTDDILFTNRGEIGKVAIVDERFNGSNLNSQIAWLRCIDGIIPEYLFFFLQSRSMKNHFAQNKSGAALQQFTIRMIKKVIISYPLKNQQSELVNKLKALSTQTQALEALYQQKIDALNELKQSLLQKAFAGELTHTQEVAA